MDAYDCSANQTGGTGRVVAHDVDPDWLAAHDAEVAARALEDAAFVYRSGQLTGIFTGRDDYTRAWLGARAAAIRGEHQ